MILPVMEAWLRASYTRALWALVLSSMVLAIGCRREDPVIRVEVCGDVAVPESVDAIRVTVLDEQRQEVRAGARELVVCPDDVLLELPQTVEFEPLQAPTAWVVVQGLEDGVERIRFERQVSLDEVNVEIVRVGLRSECLGVTCPDGQTCVQGACQISPVAEPDELCAAAVMIVEDVDMGAAPNDEGADMGQPVGPRYCPADDDMGGM